MPSLAAALLTTALASAAPQAETPAGPAVQRALGEVTAVDADTRRISVKTDAGEPLTVLTDEKTALLRTQPGARDLAGATPLTLGEIAVGDRVLARGTAGAAGTLSARQVVVMARADIAQKQEQDTADWRRRGASGVITAIDAAAGQITVEVRSLMGSRTLIVSTAERKPTFKRYAPESVRFADARPSSFAELRVGDQVRVLGDRTPDGAKLLAEQVVSGSFQIVSGAVKSVEGRSVTIEDHETSKPLVVALSPEALVRRLPSEMATRLAMRSRGAAGEAGRVGAAGGGTGAPGGPGRRPGGGEPGGRAEGGAEREAGAPGEGGRRMGGGAPTLHDMLERLPALPVEQLKPGDQVAVSVTKAADGTRATAFVLLAGIEPLLEARPRAAGGGGEALGLAAGALDMGLGVP
jgi:hypothetical protein